MPRLSRMGTLSLVLALGVVAAACSSPSSSGSSSSTMSAGAGPSSLSVSSFNSSFSAMSALKPVLAAGKGKVGALLPDTASSARYMSFDAPYLTKAFQTAGYPSSDYTVSNAQGSDSTEFTQAEADIANGASVLLMDPLDSTVGGSIESYAKQHAVKVVDYDRLTLGGSREYYVSFNNVRVGNLIGQGAVDCVSSWNVSKPQVFELDGPPTDNNAIVVAQGYNQILQPKFASATYTKVGEQSVPNWDNQQALTIFQQQYSAHPNINVVVSANDGLGNSVISALKTANVPPKKIPVTGQDATLEGLQNTLQGYQCGSVYKPIYTEAQAAVALATYVRANQKPPSTLVNGTTQDTTNTVAVPSSLLTPIWVTAANMESTVVRDAFVSASEICTGPTASYCAQSGIR